MQVSAQQAQDSGVVSPAESPTQQSAPQQVQDSLPQAPQESDKPRQPVLDPEEATAQEHEAERKKIAKKAAAALEHRDKIIKEARAKALERLRSAREVEEPEPKKEAAKPNHAPEAKKEAPSVEPTALANAFAQRLQAQAEQAKRELAEAKALREQAAADRAELEESLNRPYDYLKKRNMDLDQWTARLHNGGAETPQEREIRLLRESHAETQAQLQRLRDEAAARDFEAKRQVALANMEPALRSEYPLIHRLMGASAALEELRAVQAKTPTVPIDAREELAKIEDRFKSQYEAILQDEGIRGKYKFNGATQPQRRPAETQTPRTLTNGVTSTTSAPIEGRLSLADKRARARAWLESQQR